MSTVFRVEKNGNFTVMSNIHLKDRKLSLRAKGLLSVILSLPPEWDYTVKGLAKIVADGVDSVRTAVKELESFGYITRRQTRDEFGKMAQNEYHVYENPKQNPDFEQETNVQNPEQTNVQNSEQYARYSEQTNANLKQSFEDYEQPKSSKSEKADNIFLASPLTEKPLTENPATVKSTTDTYNNILNTQKSNPHQSITHSRASRVLTERTERVSEERENYISLIHENIDFDGFAEKEKVSELVKVMADVAFLRQKSMIINGGEVTIEQVRQRFLELRREHIEQVLASIERNAGSVRNIRAYLITLLYNSPTDVLNFRQNPASYGNNFAPQSNNPGSYGVKSAPQSYNPASTSNNRASYNEYCKSSFDIDDVMNQIKARYRKYAEDSMF